MMYSMVLMKDGPLREKEAKDLCEVLKQNTTLTELILSREKEVKTSTIQMFL